LIAKPDGAMLAASGRDDKRFNMSAAHDPFRDTLDRADAVLRRKERSGTSTDRTIFITTIS
jgi:hypothetical protein